MPVRQDTKDNNQLIDITQISPERRISELKQQPSRKIPISELQINYQSRRPDADSKRVQRLAKEKTKEHIDGLTQSLTDGEELEPISVVMIGQRLHLVDGYHRRRAYMKMGLKEIPARIVQGDENVARVLSVECNQKSKHMGVSDDQKAEQTWELVKENYDLETGRWTENMRAEIKRIFGYSSYSQIDNMRKKYIDLGEQAEGLRWKQARSHREFKELTSEEKAERALRKARDISQKIGSPQDMACLVKFLSNQLLGQDTEFQELIELQEASEDQLMEDTMFNGMVEDEEF